MNKIVCCKITNLCKKEKIRTNKIIQEKNEEQRKKNIKSKQITSTEKY